MPCHVWLFLTPWTVAHQASLSLTISCSLPRFMPIESVMLIQPSAWIYDPTISSSATHFSCCPQSFPALGSFPMSQVVKVLELQLQHQSFQWVFKVDFLSDWLVWSPCCPTDSQESSPPSQFESINSLVLSFLYGPTLTSICGYWKGHSLDYTDLSWQRMSLLFNILSRFVCYLRER